MAAVVVEERVLRQLRDASLTADSGLLLGQVLGDGKTIVLQLVPGAAGVEIAAQCEQLERCLIGGVALVGVWSRSDKAATKRLLFDCFFDAAASGVPCVYSLNAPNAALARHSVTAGALGDGVPVTYSVAQKLNEMVLYGARLAVRMDVAVATGASSGLALQQTADALAQRVRRDTIVSMPAATGRGASAEGDPLMAELWTHSDGPIAVDGGGGNGVTMSAAGVVCALAYVHKDCSLEQCGKFLVDDLCRASVETRVDVLLDELDAMEEEQVRNGGQDTNVLSRVRAAKEPAVRGARWTLPRRVLVTSKGAVPLCDWQMPWEYDGSDTLERCSDMAALDLATARVNSTIEPVAGDALLTLTGLPAAKRTAASAAAGAANTARKSGAPVASPVAAAASAAVNKTQPIIYVFLALIGVVLALIAFQIAR